MYAYAYARREARHFEIDVVELYFYAFAFEQGAQRQGFFFVGVWQTVGVNRDMRVLCLGLKTQKDTKAKALPGVLSRESYALWPCVYSASCFCVISTAMS